MGNIIQKESIKKNYFYNLTFQILNLILPLITTPYISRVLGADNIGIYSYTYSYVSTFVMIGSLGIGTYGQREIAAANDDRPTYSGLFWEIQTVKSLTVFLSFVCYFIFACIYKEYQIYLIVQIPYFIAAILDITWFFQGIEKFKFVAMRNIVIKLASLFLIFVLVKTKDNIIEYIVILCASQLFGNLTMWLNLRKFIDKPRIRFLVLKKHFMPTFIYFIPTVAYQIRTVLDKTILGLFCNDNAENGFYEQANKIITMATMVVSSYNTIMRSRMTNLYAKQDWDKFNENLHNALRFICLLVFPMAFGMAGVSRNLVPWFMGEGYNRVITLLYIFCPIFIFQGLRSCIGSNIITASKQQPKGNICQCIAAIVNICLNSLLVHKLASVGVTIASVVAEFVLLIGYMHYTKKYINAKMIVKVSYKYFFASIIMFIPVFMLSYKLNASMANTLFIVIVGACVYLIVLFICRDSYFIFQIGKMFRLVKIKTKHLFQRK